MNIKRAVKLLMCFTLIYTLTFSVAAADVEIPPPGYGDQYSTAENPFTFNPRADEMNPAQQRAAGLIAPFEGVQTRASVEKLCFITGGKSTVYTTASGSISKGFVSSRERVYVYNNNSNKNRYYIKFLNYGSIDYGYVDKSAVRIPSTTWAAPITSGRISQDYASNGHAGIDVAVAVGTQINAVTNASHRSRIYTGEINGTNYLINYGNYIDCTSGNYQVIYAHLSSFKNGTANSTLTSYRNKAPVSGSIKTVANFTPTKGAKIGESGDTGWSSGPHLHFEIRSASDKSVKYDPYTFVVFPNVGY